MALIGQLGPLSKYRHRKTLYFQFCCDWYNDNNQFSRNTVIILNRSSDSGFTDENIILVRFAERLEKVIQEPLNTCRAGVYRQNSYFH